VHIYILDYTGTLDQLGNPKGFVRALQSLGHKAALWTGHSPRYIGHPGLAEAVDWYISKGSGTLKSIVQELLQECPEATCVYVSDDDALAPAQVADMKSQVGVLVLFIKPSDLNAHLSSLV